MSRYHKSAMAKGTRGRSSNEANTKPRALRRPLTSSASNAILDTTTPEVLPHNNPLYRLANVFLTPHIAGSLGDETQHLTDYIVAELERYSRGMSLRHQVKREHLARLA